MLADDAVADGFGDGVGLASTVHPLELSQHRRSDSSRPSSVFETYSNRGLAFFAARRTLRKGVTCSTGHDGSEACESVPYSGQWAMRSKPFSLNVEEAGS